MTPEQFDKVVAELRAVVEHPDLSTRKIAIIDWFHTHVQKISASSRISNKEEKQSRIDFTAYERSRRFAMIGDMIERSDWPVEETRPMSDGREIVTVVYAIR